MNEPVLEVTNLKKYFSQSTNLVDTILRRDEDPIQAVDDVSLKLEPEESIGIIGESGCGKTTFLKTLIGLHEPTGGEILFHGKSTKNFGKSEWKAYRKNVQFIFQDPFNTLDPKYTIREALTEPLIIHNMDDREARVHDALEKAELRPTDQYLERTPDELSGGEKQRVSIARALILEPDVILADEPVSMLDVSTQSAVLNLLSDLIDDLGVSMLYVSHDLSTVSYICDSIAVMYLGRVIERAPTLELLDNPLHPYTQTLVNSIPIPDPHYNRERTVIDGAPQDPIGIGEGCRFRDRCPERIDICDVTPLNVEPGSNREVACHLHYDHNEFSDEDIELLRRSPEDKK